MSVRAVHDLTDEWRSLHASLFLITRRHVRHETLRLVMRHHVDRRASETAARETRAETSRMFAREFDEDVEFLGAVLE